MPGHNNAGPPPPDPPSPTAIMNRISPAVAAALAGLLAATAHADTPADSLTRSGKSGRWSDPDTWIGSKLPEPGDRVQVRAGHIADFDIHTDKPIRSIDIAS